MIDLLDQDKFLILYDQHEIELFERKQQYERFVDFEEDVESNRRLWDELSKDEDIADVPREMPPTYDTSDLLALQNNDIQTLAVPESLSAVVKKRMNVMTRVRMFMQNA